MPSPRPVHRHTLLALLSLASVGTHAADYSPHVGERAPARLLWGDTHLHSGWSADAGAIGGRLGPEEALRYARGEEVVSNTGQKTRLVRPLDFVVLSDHAEGLGVIQELAAQSPAVMADATGARWATMLREGAQKRMAVALEFIDGVSKGTLPEFVKDGALRLGIWQKNTAIQEKYNEPGRFTTLIGYEWTSNSGGGDNLHRNVIFRDGKARADQVTPFSAFDSEDPEALWQWMQAYEDKTGGQVLAIPHNGNLSNGRMFALSTFLGDPLTRDYAQARARWEPVYEVTQIKGDGETHANLSPDDEFASFERWDKKNLNAKPKTPQMLKTEYARQALRDGLALEARLGANPFKFGLIGSTDSHTGLATTDENNFFGKHALQEPSPGRATKTPTAPGMEGWTAGAGGLAAVWARDNTREAVWDALKRKEVYGTTGPRIGLRLFAGYDFTAPDLARADWAEQGYARGVPMGGELAAQRDAKGKAQTPVLMIQAAKDPLGANLDRVQVIKGWLAADGSTREKVYDVAWSGQADKSRRPDKKGRLPAVGNTVDVKDATYRNSIGAATLDAVWRDPDFSAAQRAFYYVRVIEIPTPRWTAYDAKRFGMSIPAEVPMVLQERAYSSPVWYRPGA